jgi:uncharacterized protein
MFTLINFVLLVVTGALLAIGVSVRRPPRRRTGQSIALFGAAALTIGLLIVGNIALDFWAEYLWFQSEGFADRYRTELFTGWSVMAGAALAALAPVYLAGRLSRAPGIFVWVAMLLAALFAGTVAANHWDTWLLFRHAEPTGVVDPILGRDVSFYLLTLPFLSVARGVLLIGTGVALVLTVLNILVRHGMIQVENLNLVRFRSRDMLITRSAVRGAAVAAGMLLLVIGAGFYLDRYGLVIQGTGWAAGAGSADVALGIPGHLLSAVVIGALGAGFIALGLGARTLPRPAALKFGGAGAVLALVGVPILATGVAPQVYQRVAVAPNELTAERPYIEHSIELTRRAFGIHEVEERRPGASQPITAATLAENQNLLRDVPLWDYRALHGIYNQLQRFRPYYTIRDVDIDRYRIDGEIRQVMISARELDHAGINQNSRGFVNDYIKFVSGYGVIVTPVNEFDSSGGRKGPVWWSRNMPMQTAHEEIRVTRPEIYFGEVINSPALVGTREAQFHYPSGGDTNIETHYEGNGGIPLSAPFARLAFAKRLDLHQLFTSNAIRKDSTRLLYRRQIQERVRAVAPFLALDEDPYIRIADGRLFWIIDAYTTSRHHPYSENHRGINYIRNSVKVVVDAYDGRVTLYTFDPDDPILAAWDRALPGLFTDAAEMPQALRDGVRYPETLLQIQGRVYARYHMSNPTQFYNDEERWETAKEIYRNREQPIEPYFILWSDEGAAEPEFLLVMPFTPRERPLMAGWLAGRSDGENLGRLIAYKIPHERQILGPAQFEATIGGDPELSHRLNLWNQGGSSVIRGNIITLPIGSELLHIEPIYLEAAGQSLPELQIVAVMHEERLGYGPTLEDALDHMLRGSAPVLVAGEAEATEPTPAAAALDGGPTRQQRIEALIRQMETMQEQLRELQREMERGP